MEFAWIIYSMIALNLLHNAHAKGTGTIQSLYQFGDSTSDTGNLFTVGTVGAGLPSAHLPYGETYPGRPTGRWCDGLLITDYIAEAFKLPLVNPYLDRNASFGNGANFAVAGSTALDFHFLATRGVQAPNFTTPLNHQLNWFKQHLNSICSGTPTECQDKLKGALIIVGDNGNNDITYGFIQGRSLQEVEAYTPLIVEAIANGTIEAIQLGGIRLVIPGAFPLGCLPLFLTSFQVQDRGLDEMGCVRFLNELSVSLNQKVQTRLDSLRKEYPNVLIHYADNYNAFLSVFRRSSSLGFDQNTLLKSCCGVGGQYNFDSNKFCGSPGVPVCTNPAKFINWDGTHYTQEAHRHFSKILIQDLLKKIPCSS